MKAGPFIGTLVLGLVIGGVAATLFLGSAGTSRRHPPNYTAQDRHNPIFLQGDNAEQCVAVKPDPVSGYQGDTIHWTIQDLCHLGRTKVGIDFLNGNPDDGSGKPEDTLNGSGAAELHVKIKDLTDVPPNWGKGWKFPYQLWITVNGAKKRLADPDLEVDPWSL